MFDFLFYLTLIACFAALAIAGAVLFRNYLTGSAPTLGFFGGRIDRRLDIVEQSAIDGRRRLLLVRRDNVEHLLMTGGPVDVVIETGIGERQSAASRLSTPANVTEPPSQPVFSRKPRTMGQSEAG